MIEQVPHPDTKVFVLDTNVILHDAGCLRNFEDNDIAVPITVLEELDRFKKGNEDINFQARAFLRRLDELTATFCHLTAFRSVTGWERFALR